MNWRDNGILLSARRHGETSAILEVLTASHGRYAGVLRGGVSRRYKPVLQPGNELVVEWRARLHEHIGTFRIEPARTRPAFLFGDKTTLAALSSACSVLSSVMPEREPDAECYGRTLRLLEALDTSYDLHAEYLRWELSLLNAIGFGLDLDKCVVTGATSDLVFISPRSGCAVSRRGAGKWADRMLPLPPSFLGAELSGLGEMSDGLRTIGHFLRMGAARGASPGRLPAARIRFADTIAHMAEKERAASELP